jgi:hypothetical protein
MVRKNVEDVSYNSTTKRKVQCNISQRPIVTFTSTTLSKINFKGPEQISAFFSSLTVSFRTVWFKAM